MTDDKLKSEIEILIRESLQSKFEDTKLVQIIDTSDLPAKIAERIMKKWKSTQNPV